MFQSVGAKLFGCKQFLNTAFTPINHHNKNHTPYPCPLLLRSCRSLRPGHEAWCSWCLYVVCSNIGYLYLHGLTRGCAYLFDVGSMKSFQKLVLSMIAHGYEKGIYIYVDGCAGFECWSVQCANHFAAVCWPKCLNHHSVQP